MLQIFFTLHEHRDELIAQGIIGKEKNTDEAAGCDREVKANDAYKLLTGLGIPNARKVRGKIHYAIF